MALRRLFQFPTFGWVLGIFLGYELLNFFVTQFSQTLITAYFYRDTVNWGKLGLSITLALLIGILIALTSVSAYLKYKERRHCREGTLLAGVGTIGGLVTGFCPLCTVSIGGLLLSAFGVSFSLGSLPFQGVEIQVLTVIVLCVSLWVLERK